MSEQPPPDRPGFRRKWPFQPILTHLVIPFVCRCVGEWLGKLLDRWDV
jgi:hypothetical protein